MLLIGHCYALTYSKLTKNKRINPKQSRRRHLAAIHMINFRKFNIDTNGRTSGRMKTYCPQCHDQRKDKRDKSLSVSLDNGLAYCHYCNWTCNANEKPRGIEDQRPSNLAAAPCHVLSDAIVRWFKNERAIPASVLISAGITSAEQFMPQTGKKELCICFNYYEGNRLVNTKFRDLNKNFKLIGGAELIPYNLNSILGKPTCAIVEGELDALACIAAGITEVVSVPGGANRNLSWMDRFIDSHFEDKKIIYICVDTDRKGQELRDELVRRLGAERCRIVDLAPYKDANELLLAPDGAEKLRTAFREAPEVPLEGVYGAEDVADDLLALFENGLGSGAETGWTNLDAICTFELGRLCLVTGIPGSGKSEFVDELVLRLNLRHHWKAAFFSPENMPLTYHLMKLAEKLTGTPFRKGLLSDVQYRAVTDYLQKNISSILPKDDYTAQNILEKAQELVRRKGIRQLIIDPIGNIEHRIPAGQTEVQYINAFLDSLASFARRNQCLVILVAHPRKMQREPGLNRTATPDMYDVSGSAGFFNKSDFGLVVERNYDADVTRIHVEKVKFKHLGGKGKASFRYNRENGRYFECEEKKGAYSGSIEFSTALIDNNSWLKEETQMASAFEHAE